jgi:hypothetical protein
LAHFVKTDTSTVDFGKTAVVTPNRQGLRAAFLVLIAVCTYLHVPLMSGARVLVPSFPTVVLAPLLFLVVWRSLSRSDVIFLPKVIFVLLLSIALSPGYAFVGQKFFGLVQVAMAIALAGMIVRLMGQLRPALLERTLLLLWCLVLAGCVLEVLGVIRGVSDAFRAWAYGGAYTLYEGAARDLNMVGWMRPKLFSVEPSHVTKLFIASINAWLLVRVTPGKVAVVAAATLGMLTIMGSPMLLISAVITIAILIWNRRTSIRAKVMMIFSAAIVGVLFATFFGGSTTYSNVTSRVASVGEATRTSRGMASSEQRRMVYPYITLADIWQRSPLFGVGIGGKDVVTDYTSVRVNRAEDALGNNVLAELGIYLGLLGSAWFIWLLLAQARQTGVDRAGLMIVLIILFSQLMGGAETFRYWGFIALLWGALAVADAQATIRRADLATSRAPPHLGQTG